MNAKRFLCCALLLAGLSVFVLCRRSSSQDSAVLADGFRVGQPDNRLLVDDVTAPVVVPFEGLQPANQLPDGVEVRNPVIGTLIFENDSRAVTPAFQFDTARPLVVEYMELHGRLAERLTDEQLEAGIAELRQTLDVMGADEELNEIRGSLRRLIERRPDTPAAEAARKALEQLDAEETPASGSNPFFNLGH